MSTYYIASEGQQQGPFTLQEIEQKLVQQKVNWHDYIYDPKSQDWVLMMEYAPFTTLFNQSFETPIKSNIKSNETDPMKKRIWYVLKQNNNFGPFSKVELIQMLQGKTLNEYDFIWHEGMSSWKRLAAVNEFTVQEIKSIFENIKKNPSSDKAQVFYRRRYPRAKYDGQAIVHDKKKVYKTVGLEISEGGAGLLIEDGQFSVDQQIYLHFKPAQDVPAFNAICKIVSKKGNIYGVQFIKIAAAAKSSIAQFTGNTAKVFKKSA